MASNEITDSNLIPTDSMNLMDWTVHLIDPKEKNEKWALSIFQRYIPTLTSAYTAGFFGKRTYSYNNIQRYASGTQDPQQYRTMFDPQDKEGKYLGLNFNNFPAIIPRYRQKIVADLLKIPVEFKVSAVDELANNKRNMDRARLKIQKVLDEKLAQLSKRIGYDKPIKSGIGNSILKSPVPTMQGGGQDNQPAQDIQFDFESDEEIDLYLNKSAGFYSQDVELASELTLESLSKLNELQNIVQLIAEGAVDYGAACMRTYCSRFSGMPNVEFMDVNDVMVPPSIQKDFKNIEAWSMAPMVTLNELIRFIGDKLTPDDIKKIYNVAIQNGNGTFMDSNNIAYTAWGDGRSYNRTDFDRIKIQIYYMEFRSPNCNVYEDSTTKYGGSKLKRKNYSYQPPEDSQYDKKRKEVWYDCVYKGYYIPGINRVYDFGELDNQVREKGNEQYTPYSLIYWKFDDRSLVERMIPHVDNIIIMWLKLQYTALKAKPPGYSFNVDVMNDIILGDGGTITAIEQVKMYEQTGSTLHHSIAEDGSPLLANANAPHMVLSNGLDPNIMLYWQSIRNEMQMIDDAIGTNQFTNASTPNSDSLVGIQKMAVLNSQDARYYLYYGLKRMMENCGSRLMLLVQQVAKYNPTTWDKIKSMIGSVNAAIIESLDDIPLHQFSVYIEDTLSEQEKQEVKQFLLQAYSQGKLDLSDVLQIYWVKNYKLLAKLLNLKYSKRQAQAMQMQAAGLQMQQQQAQQAAQLEIYLKNIDKARSTETAEIAGKLSIMEENLKQTGDFNKKLLAELTKIHITQQKMGHEKDMADINAVVDKSAMDYQKNIDHQTIDKQKEADMEIMKAQPPQTSAPA